MKTSLKEIIEKYVVAELKLHDQPSSVGKEVGLASVQSILTLTRNRIEIERQIIESVNNEGKNAQKHGGADKSGNEYYNEKFSN